MSVLLIRPPEQLRKGLLQATNVTGVFPALGIAYLAAVLREASMEVSILDMEAEEITLNRNLEKRLLSLSPTLIGITSTTLVWPAAAAIARFVKKVLPDVFVVAGGPQPTIYPRECLVCRAIDAVCIGEGERTIIDLAEVVSKGKKLEEVNGIAFIKKSRVLVTPAREPIEDLDSLPLPAVDLLPVAKYHALTVQTPFMTMVTSRGCPYRCKFCSQVYVGGTFRQRSAADVLSEFKRNIKELHVKEIVIFDETFTVDKDRLIQICKGIQTAGWNIRWTLRGRLDNVDREVVNWLKKAGCYGVHMGVESGEQYVLDLMKKALDIEMVKQHFKLAREAGLETRGYFMLGYPGETRETMETTIRFARELRLDWASFTVTVPHPACPLYDQAMMEGLLTDDYWREYTIKEGASKRLPYFTSGEYGRCMLDYLKWKAYCTFYLRPSLIWRKIKSPRAWILLMSAFRYIVRNLARYLLN